MGMFSWAKEFFELNDINKTSINLRNQATQLENAGLTTDALMAKSAAAINDSVFMDKLQNVINNDT